MNKTADERITDLEARVIKLERLLTVGKTSDRTLLSESHIVRLGFQIVATFFLAALSVTFGVFGWDDGAISWIPAIVGMVFTTLFLILGYDLLARVHNEKVRASNP